MIDKIQELLQREFDLNETLMVLKSPINIYWTWGVEKMYNVKNQGLILKVNGHHWKNFVLVTLAWNDTYAVTLLDEDFNISKTITEVYFDKLQNIIDTEIEYIKEYNF